MPASCAKNPDYLIGMADADVAAETLLNLGGFRSLSHGDRQSSHVRQSICPAGAEADGACWMEDRFRGPSRGRHVNDYGHG
jgi:hypothetical protein